MKKVLITPRSYGKYNKEELIALFHKNDIEPIFNPYGRIMDEKEMIQEIKDVDGLIVGVDPVNSNVLKCAPKLKAVAKYGVGTDNIDCDYAAKNGISVTKTMNANSDAVADFTMALML
ncbi:MAG: hydroxyacid dehydrogenase, partial [Erysipelotrichaceae bacterium]